MEIIYCLASFAAGWLLSSWSKAKSVEHDAALLDSVLLDSALLDEQALSQPIAVLTTDAEDCVLPETDKKLWYCDFSYLSEKSDEHSSQDEDKAALERQTQQYFLNLFEDTDLCRGQRLEGLRAAISMESSLLNQTVIEQLYSELLECNEREHKDNIISMLNLLEGQLQQDKLPPLERFLANEEPQIREEALKTITSADTRRSYKQRIETLLNHDPASEVRAMAFALLELHYSSESCLV